MPSPGGSIQKRKREEPSVEASKSIRTDSHSTASYNNAVGGTEGFLPPPNLNKRLLLPPSLTESDGSKR